MWIKRADIEGFGKLVGRRADFAEGLNCVYGPQEAGKSTLLSFFLSMLYGQAVHGRTRRDLDPSHEKHQPWSGAPYRGKLSVSLSDGREFEVARDLSGDADRADVVDGRTGRSVLSDYPRDGRREYAFVEKEAKIDKGTFEGVFVVTHSSVAQADGFTGSTISDRLMALAGTGSEKGAANAATLLQAASARIGTDRAPTQSYCRTLDRIREQTALLERVKKAHAEYGGALARQSKASAAAAAAEAKFSHERAILLHSIAAVVAELDAERARLSGEEKRLARAKGLPDDISPEDVARAESSLSGAEERFAAAREQAAKVSETGAKTVAAFEIEKRFVVLDETKLRPAENAIVDFVGVRQILMQKGTRIADIRAEIDKVHGRWGDDWARFRALSSEDIEFLFAAADKRARVGKELASLKELSTSEAGARGKRTAAFGRIVAVFAAFLGVAALFVMMLHGASRIWGAAAAAVLAAAAGFVLAKRAARLMRESSASEYAAKHASLQESLEKIELNVAVIIAPFEPRQETEVLKGLREYTVDSRALAKALEEANALKEETDAADRNLREAYSKMEQALAAIGLALRESLAKAVRAFLEGSGSEPAPTDWEYTFADARTASSVNEALAALWAKCTEVAKVRADLRLAESTVAAAAKTASETESALSAAREQMDGLLKKAGARDADELRTLLRERDELARVTAELRDVGNRRRVVLAGMSEANLKGDLAAAGALPEGASLILEEEIPRTAPIVGETAKTLEALNLELAAASATVNEGLKNMPEIAEVEETLRELEARHEAQQFHREALDAATRTIDQASTTFHEEIYPRVEKALTQMMASVTLGAHEQAYFRPSEGGVLDLRVKDPGKTTPVTPEDLSQGAKEQVYLCARLALAEALSHEERLPVLLDDPFINYDKDRLAAAVGMLKDAAARRQVFLFTCQEDVRDLAAAAGARVLAL